jgi:hypothetical protein
VKTKRNKMEEIIEKALYDAKRYDELTCIIMHPKDAYELFQNKIQGRIATFNQFQSFGTLKYRGIKIYRSYDVNRGEVVIK